MGDPVWGGIVCMVDRFWQFSVFVSGIGVDRFWQVSVCFSRFHQYNNYVSGKGYVFIGVCFMLFIGVLLFPCLQVRMGVKMDMDCLNGDLLNGWKFA